MIYLSDSQNSWDFSKPSELCRPEPGAGVWAGLSPSSPRLVPTLHWVWVPGDTSMPSSGDLPTPQCSLGAMST